MTFCYFPVGNFQCFAVFAIHLFAVQFCPSVFHPSIICRSFIWCLVSRRSVTQSLKYQQSWREHMLQCPPWTRNQWYQCITRHFFKRKSVPSLLIEIQKHVFSHLAISPSIIVTLLTNQRRGRLVQPITGLHIRKQFCPLSPVEGRK